MMDAAKVIAIIYDAKTHVFRAQDEVEDRALARRLAKARSWLEAADRRAREIAEVRRG